MMQRSLVLWLAALPALADTAPPVLQAVDYLDLPAAMASLKPLARRLPDVVFSEMANRKLFKRGWRQ